LLFAVVFVSLATWFVETVFEQMPYSGHVFVFRGRRGDLIKLLWFDGDGLCQDFDLRLLHILAYSGAWMGLALLI
jgi:IS66 Orf2 like protein